jgi:hypothetical protein
VFGLGTAADPDRIHVVVAMIVNTLNGLDRVPQVRLKTARIMRMSPIDTALRLTLCPRTLSPHRREARRRPCLHRHHRLRIHPFPRGIGYE